MGLFGNRLYHQHVFFHNFHIFHREKYWENYDQESNFGRFCPNLTPIIMATNTHLLLEIASPKCSSILIQRLPGSGMKPSNSRVEQWLVTHQSSSGARKSEREREEPAPTELWNPSLKELLELDTSGGSFYSGPAAFWSCNISDDGLSDNQLPSWKWSRALKRHRDTIDHT